MINVLVTGAAGQLGKSIQLVASKFTNCTITYTDFQELDISNEQQVTGFFSDSKFDFCFNCAAYTAVDLAEEEQEKANLLNAKAVEILSSACKNNNCKLVQISTDFVFDGKNHKPYIETDSTNPLSVYGSTKRKGELAALAHNHLVIRTSWLYSPFGKNFVHTMRNLGSSRDELSVIYDQIGTPTYAPDLATILLQICESDSELSGVYHYSNEGTGSWYDFAKAIFVMSGIKCKLKPIRTEQYPTPAERPHYSVLDKQKIKDALNIEIPYWIDSLQQCVAEINKI